MWWMSRGWVGGVFELLVLVWGYCVGVRSFLLFFQVVGFWIGLLLIMVKRSWN